MITSGASEHNSADRNVVLPSDLPATIRTVRDISESATWTDRGQYRTCDVSAVGTLWSRTFRQDRHGSPRSMPEGVDDLLNFIGVIGGELKIRVAIRVSVCPVCGTVGDNLDGRAGPKVAPHWRGDAQIIGGIGGIVLDGDSDFCHGDLRSKARSKCSIITTLVRPAEGATKPDRSESDPEACRIRNRSYDRRRPWARDRFR